jgi:hypothetical protein
MCQDGVDDWSLTSSLRISITTSGWMELHTNFQNQLTKPPRVREASSENTLQPRALSWIPTTHHPAGTKEAHIDLLVCAGN